MPGMSNQVQRPAKRVRVYEDEDTDLYTPPISGDIVEVDVGKRPTKTFAVHKNVLSYIPFFKAAMKPEWAGGFKRKPIDLTDEDPAVFEAYLGWLYSHNLPAPKIPQFMRFFDLYILGSKLVHDDFQNAVLDAVIKFSSKSRYFPGLREIDRLYQGTTTGSPARRLVVDLYCWFGSGSWMEEKNGPVNSEFMRECMTALLGKRSLPTGRFPGFEDPQEYHMGTAEKGEKPKK